MTDRRGIGTFVCDEVELTTGHLDLFTPVIPENVLKQGFTVEINPPSVLTDTGPFEFIIPRDPDHYTYLPLTRLSGSVQFLKTDGNNIGETDDLSVCNLFTQSLFKQVELELEGNQINDISSSTYALKAFIETMLTYGNEAKSTHLRMAGFEQDTVSVPETYKTKAWENRRKWISGSDEFHFSQIVHCDFLQSERFLLPNVGWTIRFIRNRDDYTFIGPTLIGRIKFKKLKLSIHKVRIAPDFDRAIESNLLKEPAMYPITQSKIRSFLINSGTRTTIIQNVMSGNLPQGLVIGFLATGSFNGDVTLNPFTFKHFKLNSLNLKINGIPFHNRPFQPNYTTGEFVREYENLFNHTGVLHGNNVFTITMHDFKENLNLYPFDFSPDLCNSYHQHTAKQGNVEIELGFETELTANIYMIVYSSYKQTVFIDSKRTVTLVE